MFMPKRKIPTKVIHSGSDSTEDEGSTSSSSSEEEVDDCDLGKSAYVRDPNSPAVPNSISDEPNNITDDPIPDDEPETSYLGENWQWNCWEEIDIDQEIPGPNLQAVTEALFDNSEDYQNLQNMKNLPIDL